MKTLKTLFQAMAMVAALLFAMSAQAHTAPKDDRAHSCHEANSPSEAHPDGALHIQQGVRDCVHACDPDKARVGEWCFCKDPGQWDFYYSGTGSGQCRQAYLCTDGTPEMNASPRIEPNARPGRIERGEFGHYHNGNVHVDYVACVAAGGVELTTHEAGGVHDYKEFLATATVALNSPCGPNGEHRINTGGFCAPPAEGSPQSPSQQSNGVPIIQGDTEINLVVREYPPNSGSTCVSGCNSGSSSSDKYALPALAGVGLGAYWLFGSPDWLSNSGGYSAENGWTHHTIRAQWENAYFSTTADGEVITHSVGASWKTTYFAVTARDSDFSLSYGATIRDFGISAYTNEDLDTNFRVGKTWQF